MFLKNVIASTVSCTRSPLCVVLFLGAALYSALQMLDGDWSGALITCFVGAAMITSISVPRAGGIRRTAA